MDATPSQSIQDLARRLLAAETRDGSATGSRLHASVRVCEKLRISLTRFAGADGFAALLRRALALARAEIPSLSGIQIKPDGSLEDLATLPDVNDAALAVTTQLLGLLVSFIGQPLTMRLVHEIWPDVSLGEPH